MISFFKILLFAGCFCFFSFGGTVDDLIRKAEQARKEYKDMEAVALYKQILQIDSNNLYALWNVSLVYQRTGWLEENREKKRQLYDIAILYADKAYLKYPSTFEANIVKAGSIAWMSEFLSSRERVHAAWDIKKYGEAALRLNPGSAEVWYLLGWLNFELSKATWIERSLASLLFGGLPQEMSLEKGIAYLEKANELKPDYSVYLYDLATFYERKDAATAVRLAKKALGLHPVAPEDFIYRKKLEKLLSRLES